jgi:hypothetical protein
MISIAEVKALREMVRGSSARPEFPFIILSKEGKIQLDNPLEI